MADLIIYHGNKNYSSWSMRGWLALRLAGADFKAVAFHLGEPGVRDKIRRHSPTGKVPALRHGDLVIWDSLAICEYLAEQFPGAHMWPADLADRAIARSISAEMHSGFDALRTEMPLNIRRSSPGKGRTPEVLRDIERISSIWRECRARCRDKGAFLFGRWCLADVMYAPVVSRFRTYAVDLDEVSQAYGLAVLGQEHVHEWCEDARAETWVEPQYDR